MGGGVLLRPHTSRYREGLSRPSQPELTQRIYPLLGQLCREQVNLADAKLGASKGGPDPGASVVCWRSERHPALGIDKN